MITIFDRLARQTSRHVRTLMLDAFYKSTCLEWHFWNDSYYPRDLPFPIRQTS
jgi:thiaminase/transcriptional activator TenA